MTILEERATSEPVPLAGQAIPDRPRWVRPALWTLLAVTAAVYLWGLGAGGWANEYYAAAVQAGTQNWKALLFGSIDPGNAISVDKPPAALWVMGLSGRIFGFGTLSMLVPQALMGVASVALVYGAVRRVSGYGAGLLAGAVMALTPVAALMFRFNNPDALLVLLLVVAGYCVTRALDGSSTRWVALAGAAVGFAFLAKLLQALLITPALALAVLVAMPGSVRQRLRDLAVGLVAMLVSAGWYLALVSLWPKDSRPYIGGSTDNSLLQLALGYNGLGRVFGGDGNPGGGEGEGPGGYAGPMGGAPMFGGSAGVTRMFDQSMGTEISWLLPAAVIGLAAGLWFTRRAERTDRVRAALLMWGGWLVVTAVVFSFMKGIMHPYYTVALAPAVAAVVGISVRELWRGRQFSASRWVLAAMVFGTGVWNFVLLDRTPDWLPWLRWTILVGSIVVAAVLAAGGHRLGRWTVALAAAGLLVGLGGTAAYTVETVAVGHSGPIPTSGPIRAGGAMGFGGPGGSGVQASENTEVNDMLRQAESRWAAATVGSMTAGSLELSTGASVMSIGGFSGGDNSPTLQQFQDYVAGGQIRYFIVGNGPDGRHGPGGESGSGTQITQWVERNFTAQDVGGTEIYDLTGAG
jgi:4-amino-4-deoxy-L-arabinose transferase-like glycosyltransferase